ncbi:MAG: DUF455 family protein [Gaiellaceae bacterium]
MPPRPTWTSRACAGSDRSWARSRTTSPRGWRCSPSGGRRRRRRPERACGISTTRTAVSSRATTWDEPARLVSPVWPAAVTKLAGEQPMPAYPQEFEAAMRRCVHDLVFSEAEALDIFGRYVYEFAELPWQFSVEAARIAWDEARHVELLLNVLDRYGGRVGEFPAKAPGYEEYVRQPSKVEQLIMVNVIAEGEISTDTQTQHREAFRQLGDELSALFKRLRDGRRGQPRPIRAPLGALARRPDRRGLRVRVRPRPSLAGGVQE